MRETYIFPNKSNTPEKGDNRYSSIDFESFFANHEVEIYNAQHIYDEELEIWKSRTVRRPLDYTEVLNEESIANLSEHSGDKMPIFNLFLNTNSFKQAFVSLAKDSHLTKGEAYLILFKKFYIDRLVTFMCGYLSGGKTFSIENLKRSISSDYVSDVKRVNAESLDQQQVAIMNILLCLEENFYNSKAVLNLKDKGYY